MSETGSPPTPASTFVTIFSWVFIILGGFATLGTLMQSLMLAFLFSNEEFAAAIMRSTEGMPSQAQFMLEHIQLVSGIALVISALVLIAALGMLRRKDWARAVFVVLMAVFALATITSSLYQLLTLGEPQATAQIPEGFIKLVQASKITSLLFGTGFGVLFAWFARKLTRPAIKAEFRSRVTPDAG